MKKAREDLILSLSLGNFWFLAEWRPYLERGAEYAQTIPNGAVAFSALIASVALTAAVIFAFLSLARAIKRESVWSITHLVLLIFLISPLNYLRTMDNLPLRYPFLAFEFWKSSLVWSIPLGFIVVSLGALLVMTRRQALIPGFRRVGILLAGFLFMNFIAFARVGTALISADAAPAPSSNAASKPLIAVILFDEMSWKISREGMENGTLPELARLSEQAFYAEHAISPADSTLASVPAILSGKLSGDSLANLEKQWSTQYFTPEKESELRKLGSIFGDAKAVGRNIGVAGFWIPYCRLYSEWLDSCLNIHVDSVLGEREFFGYLTAYVRRRFRPSVNWPGIHTELTKSGKILLADSRMDFVYLHLSIPHFPQIYDPQRKVMLSRGMDEPGYIANLALVDRTIGEFRAILERTKRWESSTIILISDHALHPSRTWKGKSAATAAPHVPFLVKFPQQVKPVAFVHKVDLANFRPILKEILQGGLRNADALSARLKGLLPIDAVPGRGVAGKPH